MAVNPQRKQYNHGQHMNVEEYFQLDATALDSKYEYHDGQISLMSGGSREQDLISFNIRTAITQQLQSGPCFVSGSDVRVRVSASHYYFPDVTVSCDVADRRRGNTLIRSPHLVIEVLSPSTEKFDRTEKMKAYRACPTIQEVVLISQFAPDVQVFRRGEEEEISWIYTAYGLEEVVELRSLDLHIPIKEIYRGIDFDEPLLEE